MRIVVPMILLMLAVPVRAQEVQVALDEDGTILVIDTSTERYDEIFPSYRGFQEARLFRIGTNSYVLEVLYRPDREVVRDRRTLTEDEVNQLRARVSATISGSRGAVRVDQSGRPRLLRQAAVTSLLFYGPALPVVLDIRDEGVASGLYLATASAGFFVPYFITRNAPVTHGAATLSRVGAATGTVHGLSLPLLLAGDDVSGRAVYGLMALGSVVESVVGYRFATARGTTRGEAEMIGAGGLFGSIAGLGLGGLLAVPPDANEDAFYEDDEFVDANLRIFGGSMLAGSIAGMYATHVLTRREPHTRGDARVFTTLGVLGVNAGLLAITLSDTDNSRVGSAMLTGGTIAGVSMGHLLTRKRNFTTAQGAYTALGAVAGGLAGLAIASIANANASTTHALGTAGATVGFGLMYYAFDAEARAADTGW